MNQFRLAFLISFPEPPPKKRRVRLPATNDDIGNTFFGRNRLPKGDSKPSPKHDFLSIRGLQKALGVGSPAAQA